MANLTAREERAALDAALQANNSAPNYWDPTATEYQRDTAEEGIPFLVIAVILLLAFLIFFVIRIVCCTCCGKGCCARNKRPVTTKTVIFNLVLCSIPIGINFVGGAILMSTANPVNRSLKDFFDTTLNQLDMVRNEVGNVSASVQAAVPAGDDVDLSQLTDAERQLDAAYVDIQDLEDDTVRYLGIVEDVIWAAGAAAFALGIWGFVTLLARRSPFMTLFLLAAAIFGPACWVLGGAGYATKRLVGDACEMLERHVEGELNPWVLQEARCDELLDAIETIGPIMISANAAVREANSGLSQASTIVSALRPNEDPIKVLCVPFGNSTGFWQPTPGNMPEGCFPLREGNNSARVQYGDNVCQKDLPADDTSSPAFISCVIAGNPIKRQEYQQILEAADAVSAVSRALPQINRLTRCDFIDRAFRTILRENCPNIDHRFERMTAAALLSAIGITLASLYFCVCFRNLRHRRYHPGSEDDPEVNPKKADRAYNDSAHYTQG